MEAESLISDMEADDVREALREVGITHKQGATMTSMREALKAHCAYRRCYWPHHVCCRASTALHKAHSVLLPLDDHVWHRAWLCSDR